MKFVKGLLMPKPILSVCINTRNRGALLLETLNSIIMQVDDSIELIVVDGASNDGTETMMREYANQHKLVKYFRSDTPIGLDEGYDLAVEYASGSHCWLMTDDDLVMEGAVDRLLVEIERGFDLILLELDCWTRDMRVSLHQPLYQVNSDKVYQHKNFDNFWRASGKGISYIGSVVIRKSIWFEHDRTQYYGSYFVHVGVILESTLIQQALIIGHPYIRYRSANSSWTPRSFEIWNFKWPNLIWQSTRLSDSVKNAIVSREPWKRILSVLKSRAMGEYDLRAFNTWLAPKLNRKECITYFLIALIPRSPLNFTILLFCLIFKRSNPYTIYNLVISSSYSKLARFVSAVFGIFFVP